MSTIEKYGHFIGYLANQILSSGVEGLDCSGMASNLHVAFHLFEAYLDVYWRELKLLLLPPPALIQFAD